MDTHRTNFEKIKASGMNRILGYLNESNSVVQGIANQMNNLHLNNTNNYEQKCLFTDTKNSSACLEPQESVKIPDLILSDPTNVLFGLSASVTNPLERYKDDTVHIDDEDQKSRFILSMASNISTLCTDTNEDADGANLATVSRRFNQFSDVDNYSRLANSNVLNVSGTTLPSNADDEDPANHRINLFETSTINSEPGLTRFLRSLPSYGTPSYYIEYQTESKPMPQESDASKDFSKLIRIRGSTIKPLDTDTETVTRSAKPVVYGLSPDLDIIKKNVQNINVSTQTEKTPKARDVADKKEGSNILPTNLTANQSKVQIGYKDSNANY